MHLSINGVSDPAYLSFYSCTYIHLVLHNYYYVTVQVSLHACGGDTVIMFLYECRAVTTEVQLIADLMTVFIKRSYQSLLRRSGPFISIIKTPTSLGKLKVCMFFCFLSTRF